MPVAAHALRHDARKPSDVHGLPSLFVSMMVERFGVASSAALSGAPTGIATRAPVLDWRSRIYLPYRPTMAGAADRLVVGQSTARAVTADADVRARAGGTRLRQPPSRCFRAVSRGRGGHHACRDWRRLIHDQAPTTAHGRARSKHSRPACVQSLQLVYRANP